MILGTAGHIDHGKTALVRALTGVDTDRLPEEKRRGITIDLGFAPLVIEGIGTIGVVDVPGHENFVRTMLAGASGIDLALLVIAADEGVMPQTREHLEILSLLRIPKAVVAITKTDLVDEDWRSLVADDVRALVKLSPYAGSEMVFVSSYSGSGISDLRTAIARAAANVKRDRNRSDLFRMPVDRAFTVKGTGTVVTGTVWSGSLSRDASVRIEPGGKVVRVRGIQSHGAQMNETEPGTRVALALAGCELTDVSRGKTIVLDDEWIASNRIDAILEFTDHEFEPNPRTRVRVHLGTADVGGRLSRLSPAGNGKVTARLVLDSPLVARGGDRIVLRSPSPARTIGGGEVIDPHPRRSSRPSHSENLTERADTLIADASGDGVSVRQLSVRLGVSPHEVSSILGAIGSVVIGNRAWSASVARGLEDFVETYVNVFAANHPLEDGVSLQTLRAAAKAPLEVMDLALNRLHERKRIELKSSTVRPFGWVSQLAETDQTVSDAILHEICTHAAEPPSVAELNVKFGRNTVGLLRRLEREGLVERVSEDRFYARDAVSRMVGALRGLPQGKTYSPAELREVLGVSRKYLIPFLEFCDKKGVTRRAENGRSIQAVDV